MQKFLRPILGSGVGLSGLLRRDVSSVPTLPTLPSWLTHAWEEPSVADGAAITTHTDLISGVVASSSGTARPIWRSDYAGTGVAGVEYDGVDDILTTTTNVDLTGGYTYSALVYFSSISNFRLLFEIGAVGAQQGCVYTFVPSDFLVLAERVGTVTSIQVSGGAVPGGWHIITAVHDGASSELFVDGVSIGTGTVTSPTSAQPIRFGKGTGALSTRGMEGAIAAHYFGPVSTPAQRTGLRAYINYKNGLAL